MIIKNATVLLEQGFVRADVRFEKEILEIGEIPQDGLDAKGAYLVPGLVDIHTHGAKGADFCDATPEALQTMSRFYAQNGVTSFVGATMALPEEQLLGIIDTANAFTRQNGARLLGIHMEGPFIQKTKPGAHNARYIQGADIALFDRLQARSQNAIRIADVAPNNENALAFISHAAKSCVVSLGHTDADYAQAMAGFEAGATHVTHLFNVMPPFLHRAPGLIGAARDAGAFVELICDGIHMHESVARAAFSMFEKVCLISDSMRAAGLDDGTYDLGGQTVTVKDKKATLIDGTIAGSCISLLDGVKNAVRFGIPLEAALAAASRNPVLALGANQSHDILPKIGKIEPGYLADIVLLDNALQVQHIFIEGGKVV